MSKKYYMSSIQKRLYIIHKMENGISYNTPKIFEVKGRVDIHKLNRAFEQLCDRYELLRTTFEDSNDKFYQIVHENCTSNVEEIKTEESPSQIIEKFVRPFRLDTAPLMRIGLVHGNETQYVVLDFHHIICDAFSVNIYLQDLLMLYEEMPLSDIRLQYKDYAAWQLKKDMMPAKVFWKNEFKQIPESVDLRTDFIRPNNRNSNGKTIIEFSNYILRKKVTETCKEVNVSEFAALMAAFFAFLAKYNSQENITIGVPMANRTHEATVDMPGMFINTVAIMESVDLKLSFEEFAKKVQDKLYHVMEYQDYPFENLVEQLQIPRDISRNPLFDIMFVYQNEEEKAEYVSNGFSLEEIKDFGYNQAKFDLTFSIAAVKNGYDISWEYCTDLFKEETVKYINTLFQCFANNVLAHCHKAMEECSMISISEKNLIIEKKEKTERKYLKASLLECFQQNVQRMPDKEALADSNNRMTFKQLDLMSNKMANYLIKIQKKKHPVIGILFNRSIETIITILAVLKSGGIFLPIESSLPDERINYILKDSEAELLITNIVDKQNMECHCKCYDYHFIKRNFKYESEVCRAKRNDEKQLVYIIYTSGSTGRPKGVAVKESGLMNYLDWAAGRYIKNSEDCFGFYSPLSFDLTMTSVFLPLLYGLTMRIYYARDYASSLMDLVEENKVTILKLTPSHIKMMNQMEVADTKIHTFIVGGEELTVKTASEITEKISHRISIINEYGPTEATIGCCVHEFNPEKDVMNVPIGRPINNTELYVLDSCEQILPYGVTGELYIAGEGLALGYYNNEMLTNEKFVNNPFRPGEKMYATGDLAYKDFNGNYIYCKRKDTQTKLKGFRIELEEVEKVICRESDSEDVYTMIYKTGESEYLCAYIVGAHIDFHMLQERMKLYLPDYMIPSFFMRLDYMPLTINGKVDKKKLPIPDVNSRREYVKPRNRKEEEILNVFSDVLRREMGLRDYFFEMGGDSIKAIRVASKLKEKGYDIPLRKIMSRIPLEKIISCVKAVDDEKTEYESVEGPVENSYVQQLFWESNMKSPEYFHQSLLLETGQEITYKIVLECFQKLVQNYDMLRAKYKNGEQIIKNARENDLFELQEEDVSGELLESCKKIILNKTYEINNSFDLEEGRLMKGIFFKAADKNYLYIVVHHLVIDSFSWNILLDDLNGYCRNILKEESFYQPKRSAPYLSWVREKEKIANLLPVKREKRYWDIIESFIIDNPASYEGKEGAKLVCKEVLFEKELTKSLVYDATISYGMEVKDILLTALVRSMAEEYQNESQVISIESHGRENEYSTLQIDRTVGWFTGFYPVLFKNIGYEREADLINVKETLRDIPNHGADYHILKQCKMLKSKKELTPLLNFNYQGSVEGEKKELYFKTTDMECAPPMAEENFFGAPVSVDGKIEDGRLLLIFSCGEELCEELKIEELIEKFREELFCIVNLCKNRKSIMETPSDLGYAKMNLTDFKNVRERAFKSNMQIQSIYPLTPLQKGMLYQSLDTKEEDGYMIQSIFDLCGALNLERLQHSLEKLLYRHEVLRTRVYYYKLTEPCQIIVKDCKVNLEYSDNTKEGSLELKEELSKDRKNKLTFENDALIRFKIFKIRPDYHIMLMTYHHIIIDGWSTGILLKDLTRIYNNPSEEVETAGEGNYREYAKLYSNGLYEDDREYWSRLLKDFSGENSIQGKSSVKQEDFCGENIQYQMDQNLFHLLRELAKECQVTLNTVVEYVWGRVLQSYGKSHDAVFGKIVSGRECIGRNTDNSVGLYINTIPVRVKEKDKRSVKDAFISLQQQGIDAIEHELCSLADIQSLTEYNTQLIKTIIVFENFYITDKSQNVQMDFMSSLRQVREATNYELTLSAEISDTLLLDIMYYSKQYTKKQVKMILERMESFFRQICEKPGALESDLEILSEKEKDLILNQFNHTKVVYDEKKVFWDYFAHRIAEHKDGIALEYGDKKLCYDELREYTDLLSGNLLEYGIKENDIVALEMTNSMEMIISIIGIWKLGAAYVPLDPAYPASRKRIILEDCKPKIIITNISKPNYDSGEIFIGELFIKKGKKCDKFIRNPEGLAYVLYTSGTTGIPKGVMVTQRNVLSYIHSFQQEFHLDTDSRILQQGTYTFDVFIEEVFPALASGGTVVVYPKKEGFDFEELCRYINQHKVDIVSCSPLVLNEINRLNITPKTGIYISGGDELKYDQYTNLISHADIYNTYGPTETTVCATYYKVDRKDIENIPIGHPIANVAIYILNRDKLCGIGSTGEICIGGTGVSNGYLNNKELTLEKFTENPYGNGRIYRTGDLGRWTEDGNIIFEGRIDNQIKIRGYRVELSGIEAAVKEKLPVQEAVALLKECNSEKVICLYVQSRAVTREEVYNTLKKHLPVYLVPARIEVLEELPLKENGKIDSEKLKIPEIIKNTSYKEMMSKEERLMSEAYSRVLNGIQVGSKDDFLELGGHSLTAARLINEIENTFGVRVKISDVFRSRTPENLCTVVQSIQLQEKEKDGFDIEAEEIL